MKVIEITGTRDHKQEKTLTGKAAQALAERDLAFRDYESSPFLDR